MKGKKLIEWFMGFFAGIVAPLFGLVIFFETKPEFKMYDNFDPESFKSLIFQIASVGLIINMGLFFVALKFNRDVVSKGILHATVTFLVAIVAYKFIPF